MAETGRKNLGWRYKALPYIYTAFFDAHQYGSPVARPLFYTFPSDTTTWSNNGQWMMGDGIMIAPCLQENGSSVNVYFPQGTWYSLYNYGQIDASAAATNRSLEVGLQLPGRSTCSFL